MVRLIVFILMVLLFDACILDQKLSMIQTENVSDRLRLDGIYLYEDSLEIVDLYYLYRDGTILSRGSIPKDGLEKKLALLEFSDDEKYKSMKFLWGRYIIDGETITFQKWGTSDKNYITFTKGGHILNDTTFLIDKYYHAKGKGFREVKEIYQFRKTMSKPDSNNKWLEPGG